MPKKIHPSRRILVDKKWPRKLSSENVHENSPSCSKGSLPRYFLNDLNFNLYNHELMFRQIRSKTRFSNWVDLKKDWVALKKFSILLLPCRAIGSVLHRGHFFYYDKSQNGKRFPSANVNYDISFGQRMVLCPALE